jgi:hypothetical protein
VFQPSKVIVEVEELHQQDHSYGQLNKVGETTATKQKRTRQTNEANQKQIENNHMTTLKTNRISIRLRSRLTIRESANPDSGAIQLILINVKPIAISIIVHVH